MSLRLSRNQCEATLNLAGCEHVWCDMSHFVGYGVRANGRGYKPSYTLGRRHRRLASFAEIMTVDGRVEYREGWTGWRIDELRMAVKQIVQGESPG